MSSSIISDQKNQVKNNNNEQYSENELFLKAANYWKEVEPTIDGM